MARGCWPFDDLRSGIRGGRAVLSLPLGLILDTAPIRILLFGTFGNADIYVYRTSCFASTAEDLLGRVCF